MATATTHTAANATMLLVLNDFSADQCVVVIVVIVLHEYRADEGDVIEADLTGSLEMKRLQVVVRRSSTTSSGRRRA